MSAAPKATRPIALVFLASALFGTTGTALAKGPANIDAISAGVLRLIIGGLALTLISWRHFSTLKDQSRHLLLGAIAVATYQLLFFYSVSLTGVALAALITIGVSPLFSRLISHLKRQPAPSPMWYVAAAFTLSGLVVLVFALALFSWSCLWSWSLVLLVFAFGLSLLVSRSCFWSWSRGLGRGFREFSVIRPRWGCVRCHRWLRICHVHRERFRSHHKKSPSHSKSCRHVLYCWIGYCTIAHLASTCLVEYISRNPRHSLLINYHFDMRLCRFRQGVGVLEADDGRDVDNP